MQFDQTPASRRLWIWSLVAALAFLAIDSAVRLRGVHQLTDSGQSREVALDPASGSGYEGDQRKLVVPIIGTDGYQWTMQAQQMAATGSARIRHVDYDGPPVGRDAHWSSVLPWAAVTFGWIDAKVTGNSLGRAIEDVVPWVNTALVVMLILAFIPAFARRLGAVPAATLAVALVTTYPVYEFFAVGNFDHHGLAAFAAMCSVLCLVAGGAGWIRNVDADAEKGRAVDRALHEWLPDRTTARRWFIASGIAAGAGLWISAASQIPVLVGLGLAAVVSAFVARGSDDRVWCAAPELWRAWGIAGAATSVAFYLVEYFPSHMSLRLEVNNPLYAVALLGAGDLLYRVWARTSNSTQNAGASGLIAADIALICIAPAVMVFDPNSFMLRPGSFIWTLHENYISEFRGLLAQVAHWSWLQLNAGIGLLPLLLLVPAARIAMGKRISAPLRSMMLIALIPALAFAVLALRQGRWLGVGFSLWLAVLAALMTVTMLGTVPSQRVRKALLIGAAFALPFAILPIAALRASGGVPSNSVQLVPILLTSAIALAVSVLVAKGTTREWTGLRLTAAGAALGMAFMPFPALSLYKWTRSAWVYPPATQDFTQVVTRDVAQKLRARLGSERGYIASGPTTTTLMTYYGGFKGLGTLYWENNEGLAASARLFGATADDSVAGSARDQIRRLGITHVVLFSWNAFADEYAALAPMVPGPGASAQAQSNAAFGQRLLQGQIPPWLRPLSYQPPSIDGGDSPWALVLEVVPDQTVAQAATRSAQYALAMNDEAAAVQLLNGAIAEEPDFAPALITLARIQMANPARGNYRATVATLRRGVGSGEKLALEDEIGLATLDVALGDTAAARIATAHAVRTATVESVRRLPWDYTAANFLMLARQFHLASTRPEITALILRTVDPAVRQQLDASASVLPATPPKDSVGNNKRGLR